MARVRLDEASPRVRFILRPLPISEASKSSLTFSLASLLRAGRLGYVGAPEFLTHPKAESGRNACSPETGGPES